MSKAAHERMLNGQGRKVVKERVGGDVRSFDHFKGMHSNDVDRFDSDWNRVANQMGFNVNNRPLEYGGQPYGNRAHQGGGGNARRAEARGLAMPE